MSDGSGFANCDRCTWRRSLLSQASDMVATKLEEQNRTAVGLVTDLAKARVVLEKMAVKVEKVHDMLKGLYSNDMGVGNWSANYF